MLDQALDKVEEEYVDDNNNNPLNPKEVTPNGMGNFFFKHTYW